MRALKYFIVAMASSTLSVSANAEGKLGKELPAKADTYKSSEPVVTLDTAYLDAFQEEIRQQKNTEELEKKAARNRDREDSKRNELEREIAIKKIQIEDYKQKQVRISSEMKHAETAIGGLTSELNTTENDLTAFRQSVDQQLVQTDKQKKDYALEQKRLEEAQEKLRTTKAAMTKALFESKIEAQKMRSEVAAIESKVESLEAQNSAVKADEARVQVELAAVRDAISDREAETAKALADLEASKKKFEQAKMDFVASNVEYKKAEAKKIETDAKVAAEVRKYEEATMAAIHSKSMNESEKFRIEAETEKFKTYLASVKRASNEAIDSAIDTQASVMELKLAMQTVKTELAKEVASSEKLASKKDKSNALLRQLASVSESSDMVGGAKAWVVGKVCKLHKRASASSDQVSANISVGQKLIGANYSKNWIKVLNSSGAPAYISKDCGSFE